MSAVIIAGLQDSDVVHGVLACITLVLDVLLELLLVHPVEQVLNLLICVQNKGKEGQVIPFFRSVQTRF